MGAEEARKGLKASPSKNLSGPVVDVSENWLTLN